MKMTHQDYESLQRMVKSTHVYQCRAQYKEKGLSDRRWRWDCIWDVPSHTRTPWFNQVYKYLDDTHIDTALRKITGTK